MTPIEFARGSDRNGWMLYGAMDIYLRNGFRVIPGYSIISVLEIANVSVTDPDLRSKGTFSACVEELFQDMKTYVKHSGIYIENVGNDRLSKALDARGWQPIQPYYGECLSFFLSLKADSTGF